MLAVAFGTTVPTSLAALLAPAALSARASPPIANAALITRSSTSARAATSTRLVADGLRFPSVLLASLVNPMFEEVFVCGYVVSALKKRRGVTLAVNVSAGIRVLYHFYQGALGVLGIAPMALLFGYWFARTGRLWPLIVAHVLQDFIGLMAGG